MSICKNGINGGTVSLNNTEKNILSFYDGMREGVALYAYWKDGVQYVGTTGKTLKKALEDIASEEQTKLEEVRYYGGGR
jgi:hypothetical protein